MGHCLLLLLSRQLALITAAACFGIECRCRLLISRQLLALIAAAAPTPAGVDDQHPQAQRLSEEAAGGSSRPRGCSCCGTAGRPPQARPQVSLGTWLVCKSLYKLAFSPMVLQPFISPASSCFAGGQAKHAANANTASMWGGALSVKGRRTSLCCCRTVASTMLCLWPACPTRRPGTKRAPTALPPHLAAGTAEVDLNRALSRHDSNSLLPAGAGGSGAGAGGSPLGDKRPAGAQPASEPAAKRPAAQQALPPQKQQQQQGAGVPLDADAVVRALAAVQAAGASDQSAQASDPIESVTLEAGTGGGGKPSGAVHKPSAPAAAVVPAVAAAAVANPLSTLGLQAGRSATSPVGAEQQRQQQQGAGAGAGPAGQRAALPLGAANQRLPGPANKGARLWNAMWVLVLLHAMGSGCSVCNNGSDGKHLNTAPCVGTWIATWPTRNHNPHVVLCYGAAPPQPKIEQGILLAARKRAHF
jgi:hypothetical protein